MNDHDCCRKCGWETAALTGEGLCARCLHFATVEAETGIAKIGAYLGNVAAFQNWLHNHGRAAA